MIAHRVLALLLAGLLPGCAGLSQPPVAGPSVGLLQPCQEPAGSAETNGAIAAWLLAYRGALRACNDQITTFKGSQ